MSLENQPPPGKLDRVKRIARRQLVSRGISIAVGVGVGFWTGKYHFITDNPTVYNPQMKIDSENQEPISFSMQELAESAQRVDDLGRTVNEFVIEPFIGFNSSPVWSQNKEQIARLMASTNPKESIARWEFRDKERVFFDCEIAHSYKDDGRLFASTVASRFGFAFMASRGLLGTLALPRVAVGFPTVYEGRPRIIPEKLREIAEKWIKLPDYVQWGDLKGETPNGDDRFEGFERWSLTATGKLGERAIEFTVFDSSQYILKVIEQTNDTQKRKELFGSYVTFNKERGIYSVSPYPVIQEGQLMSRSLAFGSFFTRDLPNAGRYATGVILPNRTIQARHVAEVFGERFGSSLATSDIQIENGRNTYKGGLYYVLMNEEGNFVDIYGDPLTDNKPPYYLPSTQVKFTPTNP